MKLEGGYNVNLAGRPSDEVEVLPEQSILHLPLKSSRFSFTEVSVHEGDEVQPGHVLARDPHNHSIPLLAPRAGIVRLAAAKGHITLDDVLKVPEEPYYPGEDLPHAARDMGSSGMKRYKLLELGAWQSFYDVHTGEMPGPYSIPHAVIVSVVSLEPFLARGNVQLAKRLRSFTRGLEHLQSLLEYQPIYLVLPDIASVFASQVRDILRGYAWVRLVEIPSKYPFDNFRLLARSLHLRPEKGQPIWGVRTEGILAIDRASTLSLPCTARIVSVGGPAVRHPVHVKAFPGYPIKEIADRYVASQPFRMINGGALTGQVLQPTQLGLDAECSGLTILPEEEERHLLAFTRPRWRERSYSRCFLGFLGRDFPQQMNTGLRGEPRPCVACGYCEEICPARIMPQMIHRQLYQGAIEEAERLRVDLCVGCALCSLVCPSKIELRSELLDAQRRILTELRPQEAQA